MLRSLFSGISGMRAHQQMMDITGNNIANVNTVGFKLSQTVFEDTLSQMVKAASAPRATMGGTNPAQIGLGVRLAAINTNFAQGSAQTTSRNTDLMVSGDGFFVLQKDGQEVFSRAGAFSFDSTGRLVNPEGLVVQGWTANSGVVDTNTATSDVILPITTLMPPTETTSWEISGNLPADSTSTAPLTQSVTVFDAQGNEITLTASWERNISTPGTTAWDLTLSDGTTAGTPQTVSFPGNGGTPNPTSVAYTNGNIDVAVDIAGVTSYAGKATIATQRQNGAAMGALTGYTFARDGLITGTFSNGIKQPVAKVALASFNNPTGLEKAGDSTYRSTMNSGLAQVGEPGSGSRGELESGSLEMSNVDLGQEFTNLIIAQRGFQANSKIISSSDELLQDLVNLKR